MSRLSTHAKRKKIKGIVKEILQKQRRVTKGPGMERKP